MLLSDKHPESTSDLVITHPRIRDKIGPRVRDLTRYLYLGGAAINAVDVQASIENDELGKPISERHELLRHFKMEIEGRLKKGGSPSSARTYLDKFRQMAEFCDQENLNFSMEDLKKNYLLFCEYLFLRSSPKIKLIKRSTAYNVAGVLSSLFSSMLGLKRNAQLIYLTRINSAANHSKKKFKDVHKQNLSTSFKFGNFLVNLIDGLSPEAIQGQLPLKIQMDEGLVNDNQIILNAGLYKEEISQPLNPSARQKFHIKKMKELRAPTDQISGRGGAKRQILVNLRVQAEFMLFIAQTGMNYTQALELKASDFKFSPAGDGWKVQAYKNRRGGEVNFKIFEGYKPYFVRLRAFIKYYFPNSEYFFPYFSRTDGIESKSRTGFSTFFQLKKLCLKHNIPWVTPRNLRSTRINWLYRRTGDENLTAEIAQHGKKVLKQNYLVPNQQRSMIEITRFWSKFDPLNQNGLTSTLIGSICNGKPISMEAIPEGVAGPNCITPSGCLWCKNHRDLDSADYVWSLASMREIRLVEASKLITPNQAPVDHVIDRLSAKLEWYKSSSSERNEWVTEASAKINEGDIHPDWSAIMDNLE